MRSDLRDCLGVGQVGVEEAAPGHGKAAGVGEDVADRARFRPGTPSGDVLRDPVVEGQAAGVPKLEEGGDGHRLARGVQEHEVVRVEIPPGDRFADGGVEEDLARLRGVDLGAEMPVGGPLPLEQFEDPFDTHGGARLWRRRARGCPGAKFG